MVKANILPTPGRLSRYGRCLSSRSVLHHALNLANLTRQWSIISLHSGRQAPDPPSPPKRLTPSLFNRMTRSPNTSPAVRLTMFCKLRIKEVSASPNASACAKDPDIGTKDAVSPISQVSSNSGCGIYNGGRMYDWHGIRKEHDLFQSGWRYRSKTWSRR